MKIGEVAQQAGVSAQALRYYESIGIISPIKRSSSGYREFAADVLPTLALLRKLKNLGFTLNEAKEFLDIKVQQEGSSRQVKQVIEHKIATVQAKIDSLEHLKRSLQMMDELCDGSSKIEDCPIIHALEIAESGKQPRPSY